MNWLINHPHLSNHAKAIIGLLIHLTLALAVPLALLAFSCAFFYLMISLGIPT